MAVDVVPSAAASTAASAHLRDTELTPFRAFRVDVTDAVSAWRAWVALALMDIKHKYRRSVLGPFWITISMFVLILGVGLLYAKLFRMDLREYLPYIALGDIVWIYISTTVQEGCTTFTASENLIRSMRLPSMLHVMRTVLRNFIVFLHGAVAYIPFAVYLKIQPEVVWLLAIPGVFAIFLATIPVTAIFGVLAARYRDLQPAIANFMQLGFFLTPIIWKAEMLGTARWVADLNPLYHFIQLVREPLMGKVPSSSSYLAVCAFITIAYVVAIPLLARNRQKIAFWV